MGSPGPAKIALVGALLVVSFVELGMHAAQVRTPPLEADLRAARAWVQARKGEHDAVVFAPTWIDPVGRTAFGGTQTTIDATYSDVDRYAHVFEVIAQGATHPDTHAMPAAESADFGQVHVVLHKNPGFVANAVPLLTRIEPGQIDVSVRSGNTKTPCDFAAGGSGGIWSPPVGLRQFSCGYGAVSLVVLPMLDYRPRSCIYAPPPGGKKRLSLRFRDVSFQQKIVGHHGLMVQAEHGLEGLDVAIEFSVDAELPNGTIEHRSLGTATHRDGDGFTRFEIDTLKVAGQVGDLTVEVTSPAAARQYCFDADTR